MGRHALPYDADGEASLYKEQSLLTSDHLALWAGFPLAYTRAHGPYRGPNDYRDYPTLACIVSGRSRASVVCNSRPFEIDAAAGSIGLFAPHTDIRHCHWDSNEAQRIIICLDASALDPAMAIDGTGLAAPLQLNLHFNDPQLLQAMAAIAQEVAHGCPNGKLYAESLSLGLSLYLRRNCSARATPRTLDQTRMSTRQLRFIDDYIRASLREDITVDTLAQLTGYGKAHFMKRFKQTTGSSPYQYVMRLRVEHGLSLMRQGYGLADVAELSGFSSQSHFSSVFARFHGVPPKKFMHSELRTIPRFRRSPG